MYIKILTAQFCKYSIHIRGYSKYTIQRYRAVIGLFCNSTCLEEIEHVTPHANGNIEGEIEKRIEEYLEILEDIQVMMPVVNKASQNWKDEIEEGEFPLDDFFREKFVDSQFSPRDFGDVIQGLLEAEQLDYDQWRQIATLGFDHCYDQTITALKCISQNDSNDDRQFNARQLLKENNAA